MKIKTKVFSSVLVGLLAVSGSVFAAGTDTNTVSVGIQGGGLNIDYVQTAPASFPTILTDGTVKTATTNLEKVQVTDNSGTGNGWHVTVAASQFTEQLVAGGTPSGKTLPLSSLTYKGVASTSQVIGSTQTGDAIIDDGAAHTVATANAGQGVGVTNILHNTPALSLSVNTANNYVDSANMDGTQTTPYQSTLTWAVVTGP